MINWLSSGKNIVTIYIGFKAHQRLKKKKLLSLLTVLALKELCRVKKLKVGVPKVGLVVRLRDRARVQRLAAERASGLGAGFPYMLVIFRKCPRGYRTTHIGQMHSLWIS
jgi:hypothetical protein